MLTLLHSNDFIHFTNYSMNLSELEVGRKRCQEKWEISDGSMSMCFLKSHLIFQSLRAVFSSTLNHELILTNKLGSFLCLTNYNKYYHIIRFRSLNKALNYICNTVIRFRGFRLPVSITQYFNATRAKCVWDSLRIELIRSFY